MITLLVKELRDILRDKRMLAMMLLIPAVLYPATLFLTGAVMVAGKARLALEELQVAVVSDDAALFLASRPTPPRTTYVRMLRAEGELAMRDKKIAAIVDADAGAFEAIRRREQGEVTLVYTKRQDRSVEGRDRVRAVLEDISKEALVARLVEAQLPATFAEPVKATELDLDFQKDLGPYIASRLLPLLLLMMLFVGALYPAVDLTAGEKERGTLETLLVAPVSPLEVMKAKFLAVTLSALLAALANLVAMASTFAVGVQLGDKAPVKMSLSPTQLGLLLLCVLPCAVLASGVALSVATLARNFKEGQTLMTPVLLFAMVPGVMALMPGIELNALTAAIPLLNVALLVKATVLDAVHPLHAVITVASVGVCAFIALKLAARAFKSERLRFRQ